MKYRLFILFIIILASSCLHKTDRQKSNFITVDFSRHDGSHSYYSIRIDSIGYFILKKAADPGTGKYFIGKLSNAAMRNISILSDSISKNAYDTLYTPNCVDCYYYKACIYTKSGKQKIMAFGGHSLGYLDSLERILTKVVSSEVLTPADTTFQFESLKYFLPPYPTETIQFIPPDTSRLH